MACIFGGIAQSATPPASKDNRGGIKISPHTTVCEDFENELLQNQLKLYNRGIFRRTKDE